MNMHSGPSVQNTQPFIRREPAFASLMQNPVHIRQCTNALIPEGYGETRIVRSNDADKGELRDRRIEFKMY